MRWELLRGRSEGSDIIHSLSSPAWRPMVSNTSRHSGLYSLKTGCGGSGRSRGTPLWEPRSTACKGRWPASSTSRETTSGARHSNPSIQKTNRLGRWPSGWWEFVLYLPPDCIRGNSSLRFWEGRSPCSKSGGSASAGDRSFGPGSYWDGWRGAQVLLLKPCSEPE